MSTRIAVITDPHASTGPTGMDTRKGQWADTLLRRTVHRLNRFIKPDAVVVLGDILNNEHDADAMDLLNAARKILDKLEMPWLAIPGNHDPEPETFYTVFDQTDVLDVGPARIVTFADPEEPHHCAKRTQRGFERMAEYAADHNGPLVALQHVPITEPRTHSPYGYTNHDAVAAAMREHGYTLALFGHDHAGVPLQPHEGTHIMGVRALCEAPYSFALITLDGDDIHAQPLQHQLPAELKLNDYHAHSQFAYCSQNVTLDKSPAFAEMMGINQFAFTEHSGQLYFEKKAYWKAKYGERGIDETESRDRRMDDYWRAAGPLRSDRLLVGLEIDADYQGGLVVEPADLERAEITVGAVHSIRELTKPKPDMKVAAQEFLVMSEGLCRHGVDVLAHPFRQFERVGHPKPLEVIPQLVAMMKEHGTAAEINFHSNTPVPELFAACIDAGVKLSFGGDSHELWEVAEFNPQLDLLAELGYTGDISGLLIDPLR